ncbi:TetR/AcrR family transcriptional regulator [Propioniciclava flava]|nr:TetR/AcrR family transcriptional regulator [Propioniciclava flava]
MMNRAGRPLAPGISSALLAAAEDIMTERGYSELSVDLLTNTVGITRPTFYRRFRNIADLAFAVIQQRFGKGEEVNTGNLMGDLFELQKYELDMMADPLIIKNLPGLILSFKADQQIEDLYQKHFIEPRRDKVSEVVKRAISRGEISDETYDYDYLCDILLGPFLTRILMPVEGTLSIDLAYQTAITVWSLLTTSSDVLNRSRVSELLSEVN